MLGSRSAGGESLDANVLIAQAVVAASGPDEIGVGDAVMLWSVHAHPGRDVRADGGVLVESPGVYNSLNKALESEFVRTSCVHKRDGSG